MVNMYVCLIIVISFQYQVTLAIQEQKRLLITDPDFTDNQQINRDIQSLKAALDVFKQDMTQANTAHSTLIQQQASEIANLQIKLQQREKAQLEMESKLTQITSAPSGSVFIQWGRKYCTRNGTELVYSGMGGGGHYSEPGRSANPVCVPHDPDLGPVISTNDVGTVYGMEYNEPSLGKNLKDQDVPCAVCRSKLVSSVIMVPGKTRCYHGWNLEYKGMLTTGYWNHNGPSSYICIDTNPEVIEGGVRNDDGYLLFPVKAKCGSLKCPPYVQDTLVNCAVCSK